MVITIIHGPVGVGKSTMLKKQINKSNNRIVVCSSLDTRFEVGFVCLHTGEREKADFTVLELSELDSDSDFNKKLKENPHLFIEEGHFFKDIINFVNKYSKYDITIAMIDYVFEGHYHEAFESFLKFENTVFHKLSGKCNDCGNMNGEYSYLKDENFEKDKNGFIIGGTNMYGIKCKECFNIN